MHELAITQNMLDIVVEHAVSNGAIRVNKINLIIGELTGYAGDCVQFYFDFLSKGTLAEGAILSFSVVPPGARCRSCGATFSLKEFDWVCPHCGGEGLEIISGNELFVESIEVKEDGDKGTQEYTQC